MFYGNINNEFFDKQCNLMPKPLALCLKYLKENDMTKAEAGVFDLKLGNSNCILQVLDLQTNDRNNLRPEIHRKYIDVHSNRLD